MAISEVALQGILSGLKIAQERRVAQMHARSAADKLKVENEQEQAKRDARLKEHQDTVKYQNALIKEDQARTNRQALEMAQKIAAGYQRGEPAVGAEVVGISNTNGNQQDTLRFPIQNEQGSVPGTIGNSTLPYTDVLTDTPETFARKAAARKEVMMAPDMARDAAKAADIKSRAMAQKEADRVRSEEHDLRQAATQRVHEVALANLQDDRLKYDRNTKLLVQAAKQKGKEQGLSSNFNPKTWLDDIREGRVTAIDVRRGLPKSEAEFTLKEAANLGIVPYTEKQKAVKKEFSAAAQAIRLMEEFNDIFKKNPFKGRIPDTEAYVTLEKKADQVNNFLRSFSANLGQSTRISDKDARAVENAQGLKHGLKEGSLNTKALQKVNEMGTSDFIDIMDRLVDDTLSTLTPAQRTEVKIEMGLIKSPKAGGDMAILDPKGNEILMHPDDADKALKSGKGYRKK